MSTLKRSAVAALLGAAACATPPQTAQRSPGLGVPVSAEELVAWDISIPPSGAGLPAGGGNARQGGPIFEQKCSACHGAKGAGKPADPLVGGRGTLASKTPVRTVGSYWQHATTLFDYVRRSMPITNPLSLTNDEVYALSAYVLYLNGIIDEDEQMNAQSLPRVAMPNRDGFIDDWRTRAAK